MGPRFLCSEIAVSNLKHVEIIMAEEVAILEEENTMVDDGHFVKSSQYGQHISPREGPGESNDLLNPHE